jgi:hypothetical protein
VDRRAPAMGLGFSLMQCLWEVHIQYTRRGPIVAPRKPTAAVALELLSCSNGRDLPERRMTSLCVNLLQFMRAFGGATAAPPLSSSKLCNRSSEHCTDRALTCHPHKP